MVQTAIDGNPTSAGRELFRGTVFGFFMYQRAAKTARSLATLHPRVARGQHTLSTTHSASLLYLHCIFLPFLYGFFIVLFICFFFMLFANLAVIFFLTYIDDRSTRARHCADEKLPYRPDGAIGNCRGNQWERGVITFLFIYIYYIKRDNTCVRPPYPLPSGWGTDRH